MNKTEQNKVYCKNCVYYRMGDYSDYCKSNPKIEDNWLERVTILSDPSDKNAKNNCCEFELKTSVVKKFLRQLF